MANLRVTICVRNESRNFVTATPKSPAPYYLRWYVGSKPNYKKVDGSTWYDAEVAVLNKERLLSAASQGFVLPNEAPAEKSHRVSEVVAAYLADLKLGRRPAKTISGKKMILAEFSASCKRMYVEQVTRVDLMNYQNALKDRGLSDVTVLNRLMTVTTFLKKNTVVRITGLLNKEDWPEKDDTEPNPYSEQEIEDMLAVAKPEESLLIRFFLGSGMREQEVAHAEASDIEGTSIKVQAKPRWDWSPKTKAGRRKIPLGDNLLKDLKDRTGLLFPSANKNPEQHYLRIIKAVAKRAGVADAGCHRFRDTFATTQVRARELDLRDIARIMGHTDLSTMKLYAAFVDLESDQARRAANASDKHTAAGPRLVKSA